MDFIAFPKMARWNRDIIITEKIDGTNASIFIGDDGEFLTGSRTRWITPDDDNFGFSRWAHENKDELLLLGHGHHHGEWWGQGIQRGYGLTEKRFSLFNVHKWGENRPGCCHVVPTLYHGAMHSNEVNKAINTLKEKGSAAVPGFMTPEGVVIFHTTGCVCFKQTILKDSIPKSVA